MTTRPDIQQPSSSLQPGKPIPRPDALTQPFWSSAAKRILAIQRCDHCGNYQHPPLAFCERCRSEVLIFQSVTPRGQIKSFVVLWDSPVPGFGIDQPVILASVELAEQDGLMLQANLFGADPSDIQIGQEVKIVWEELRDGVVLPQFELKSGRVT